MTRRKLPIATPVKRSERAVLVCLVVAVGLTLRLAFVLTSVVVEPLRADAGQYAQYAHNLNAHGTFSLATTVPPTPDAFRSPGYPVFLAACQWLVGEAAGYSVARFLQAILSSCMVLIAFRLARRLMPFYAALAVTVLVALSPHLIIANGYILTESLTAFGLTSALLLTIGRTRREPMARFGAAGIVFGIVALLNEAIAPLPLLCALAAWRRWGKKRACTFAALALLPTLLWTVRNQSTTLAHTGGERLVASLSHGSYPQLFYKTEAFRNYPYREDPEQPEYGNSWSHFSQVFLQRAGAEKVRYLTWYLLQKPVWLWGYNIVQGASDAYVYPVQHSIFESVPVVDASRSVMRALHPWFAVLAFCGGCFSLLRSRTRPLGIAVIWCTLVYTLLVPDPRYLVPLRAVQAVLSVWVADLLWQKWRRRSCAEAKVVAAATAQDPLRKNCTAEAASPRRERELVDR